MNLKVSKYKLEYLVFLLIIYLIPINECKLN